MADRKSPPRKAERGASGAPQSLDHEKKAKSGYERDRDTAVFATPGKKTAGSGRPTKPGKSKTEAETTTNAAETVAVAAMPSTGSNGDLAAIDYVVGWFAVIDGPGRGHTVEVRQGLNTIGRDEDQSIRLDFGDNSIDVKNHARLIYDERSNQFTLAGGQSRVLIYVDEKPLISEIELKGGETIQIGDTQLLFVRLVDDDFSWGRATKSD